MRNKPKDFRDVGGSWIPIAWTTLFWLGAFMLASHVCFAEAQVVVLGELAGQLEASMHSSVLSDLQEATMGILLPSSELPDSTAVVGQLFHMKIPTDNGSVVKVTEVGKAALPSWLHWDMETSTLQGVPLPMDKGVHYIYVSDFKDNVGSSQDAHRSDAFSIDVRPEDHAEGDNVQFTHSLTAGHFLPFTCVNDEPVTVLTVILDADLTKMNANQRVDLLVKMKTFSGVELQHMKVLPVVNNRLFDMSAFMAGPGNAKKVVENGALLSWKLGCALDQTTVPDITSVQVPAKEGTMSAQLGYPVVGWHIANKKLHVPRRVKRQLNNTPTPVPSLLPPTTYSEPPSRVVPTPTSPFIAPTTDPSFPVRVSVPLPPKPTTHWIRDSISHTPTLEAPQPTRYQIDTSTILQPTTTRPVFVPTATVTPTTTTTKRPKSSTTRKPKKPKTTTPSPKTTTTKPQPAAPKNEKPQLHNPIDKVIAWVGTYFEVKIPSDTFFDKEDGTTDKLRLTLQKNHKDLVGEGSWIQFNTTTQLLYGIPERQHVGKHEYFMKATDKGDLSATDAFEAHVNHWPGTEKSPVLFVARLHGEPQSVTNNLHKKILLVKKLAYSLGDRNSSTILLKDISKGSIVVEWTNNSLQQDPCPKEQIQAMSMRISDPNGRPSPAFNNAMEPEFRPLNITVQGTGHCNRYMFVPPREFTTTPPAIATPDVGTGRQSADDVYLHTVIPAVVVAAILLIAGIIAMICYRKKRKGKLTIEDQATFIKKGVPIIFADELDDSKPPPSSSMPLILQEEKPPLPPPDYPNMGNLETTPLNQDLLGEYSALRDEDPNAPPYQPPPPFVTPMEGKGSRPRNMTPYRSPPPYVPP